MRRRLPAGSRCWLAAVMALSAAPLSGQVTESPPQLEGAGPVVRFGDIVIDKEKKSVAFPAAINLARGTLEYLLVTETGKTHESLLSTKVQPYDLQVAMLLLGLKPAGAPGAGPPGQINREYLRQVPEPAGPAVELFVSWQDGRGSHRLRAEELILNTEAGAPMTPGPWTYNGSAMYGGKFLAQVDGSIVALVRDSSALVNNPRPGNDNDQIWDVNEKLVPAEKVPVEVTLQWKEPVPK